MTQLGEAVAVPQFLTDDTDCPFSHEDPPVLTVKNDLIGVGGTLSKRMERMKPTFLHKPAPGYKEEKSPMLKPKQTFGHPFHHGNQPAIKVDLKRDGVAEDTVEYPVTSAAHHLVPAQESLKGSPLIEYMIGKKETGKSAEVKTGKSKSKKTGKCWSNVGYDVNGSQNGVYLPGNYAVNDGTWVPLHEEDDRPEDMAKAAKTELLTGGVVCDEKASRKWLYVKQAVKLASDYSAHRGYGGQFHDRHEPYSIFVQEILGRLHTRLKLAEKQFIGKNECGKCQNNKEKMKDLGVATPFQLVSWLNTVSERLEDRLGGTIWYPKLYTSEWGNAYITKLLEEKGK
jgi:hypothetical protein